MKIYRVPLKEWSANYYNGGKAPTQITLKRRIRRGVIPGTNEAGDYVVYCDANYNPQQPEWKRNQPPKTGNQIADDILQRRGVAR
ncbi:MAG: hypothetical protein ACPGSM_22085 [Thiolinea sp.]